MQKKANIDIGVAILAGGEARRLGGGDKCLLEIGGKPILRHILDRLGSDYSVALNANDKQGVSAKSRFSDFNLPIFSDSDGIEVASGPLAGILSGMEFFASRDVLIVIAGDTPFIPYDLIDKFINAYDPNDANIIFAESCGRRHPVVSLWDINLHTALQKALTHGVRKVEDFSNDYKAKTVDFNCDDFDPFFNVNYKKDIDLAESFLSFFS